MCSGRIASVAAAVLWLASSAMAAPKQVGMAEGQLVADAAEPALEQTAGAADPIDHVGRGFVAMSSRPGALGDPEALIERALAEAVDRAHRRISTADMDAEPGDGQPTLATLDSGWDDFSSLTPEHRLRRLRQVANLLSERAPSSERVLELDTKAGAGEKMVAGGGDDMLLLRILKDTIKSVQNGTFFTPERIAVICVLLLAVVMLTRLRHLGSR